MENTPLNKRSAVHATALLFKMLFALICVLSCLTARASLPLNKCTLADLQKEPRLLYLKEQGITLPTFAGQLFFCDLFGVLFYISREHAVRKLLTEHAVTYMALSDLVQLLNRVFVHITGFFEEVKVLDFDIPSDHVLLTNYPDSHHMVSKGYILAAYCKKNLFQETLKIVTHNKSITENAFIDKYQFYTMPKSGIVAFNTKDMHNWHRQERIVTLLGPNKIFLDSDHAITYKLILSAILLAKKLDLIEWRLVEHSFMASFCSTNCINLQNGQLWEICSTKSSSLSKILKKELEQCLNTFFSTFTIMNHREPIKAIFQSVVSKKLASLGHYIDDNSVQYQEFEAGFDESIIGCIGAEIGTLIESDTPMAVLCARPEESDMTSTALPWNRKLKIFPPTVDDDKKQHHQHAPHLNFILWKLLPEEQMRMNQIAQTHRDKKIPLLLSLKIKADKYGCFRIKELIKELRLINQSIPLKEYIASSFVRINNNKKRRRLRKADEERKN